MGAPRQQARHRRVLDHRAAIHHEDLVGGLGDQPEIVGDEDERHAGLLDELDQEVEDLRLDRDVERRRRLIGNEQIGPAGERHGDHRALALATRKLMRIGGGDARRLRQPHAAEQTRGLRPGGAGRHGAVQPQRLGDLSPDRLQGIERGHRLLEDHRDAVAAPSAELGIGQAEELLPVEPHRAGRKRALGQQPHQGQRRHRLAAAGFADDAEDAAALEREADAAQHGERPARTGQLDAEIGDREQRHQRRRRRRGSRRSRSPSPSRLRPSTASTMARPG